MINFLAHKTSNGLTTLYLFATTEEDIPSAKKKISSHPHFHMLKDIVIRDQINNRKFGYQAEAILSKIIARRGMWALYNEELQLIGNGTGKWTTWHCKSPLIDNEKLSMLVLHYLEKNLPETGKQALIS